MLLDFRLSLLIRQFLFISQDSVTSVGRGKVKLKANGKTQADIKLASVAVFMSLSTNVLGGSKQSNVASSLNST